jgi:hypothetical protein
MVVGHTQRRQQTPIGHRGFYKKVAVRSWARKKRAKAYTVSELKDRLSSITRFEKREQGQLMSEEQYVDWAMSAAGGRLTKQVATTTWLSWKSPDSGVPRDQGGPAEAPLRLRIIVATMMDSIQAVEVARDMIATYASVRNATAEQLQGLRATAITGHDAVLGMQQGDIGDLSYALANANVDPSSSYSGALGTSSFSFEGLSNIDLRADIMRDKKRKLDDDVSDVEEKEKDREKEKEVKETPKKQKTEKYYDAERLNAVCNSSQMTQTQADFVRAARPSILEVISFGC